MTHPGLVIADGQLEDVPEGHPSLGLLALQRPSGHGAAAEAVAAHHAEAGRGGQRQRRQRCQALGVLFGPSRGGEGTKELGREDLGAMAKFE